MSLLICIRLALKAIGRNKLRTVLTMLGIIIGVAAVITMVALGNGAQATVEKDVKSAGSNLIYVSAGNYTRGGDTIHIPSGRGAATTLTVADADEIARVAGVQYRAAGVSDRAPIAAGDRKFFTKVQGTDVQFSLIFGWTWVRGASFTAEDVRGAARVAILGTVANDRLFGDGVDPIGREIRIRDQAFKVVGVTGSAVDDQAETIFVPFTALQKMLGIAHLQTVVVAAELAGEASRIGRDITTLLRARHGLPNTQSEGVITRPAGPLIPDDFTVKTQAGAALTKGLYTSVAAFALANLPKLDEVQFEEMASTLARASTTMTALLASIAAVSLIVGGIGIMNIMLVAVTERTREIGLRMAVGARGRDVLLQFLTEAVTLSLVGGTIGIGFGVLASDALTRILQWPTAVSPAAIALAFGIAATIGVFFGYYPAHKASRLDPIDALRYE